MSAIVSGRASRIVRERSASRTPIVAFAAGLTTLVLLAALHALSPEFDPSWRVLSEYANGHYGWVLALMFTCWAVSTWTLPFALWPYLKTTSGRIGLSFLIAAGVGEALAAAFDINQPLHGLAGLLGVGGLPVAAMLTSTALRRSPTWSSQGSTLIWIANLTWIMVVVMVTSLVTMFLTYVHAGGHVPADGKSLPLGTSLPIGTIAVAGYANRLLVIVNCIWVLAAAALTVKAESREVR